MPYFLSQAFKNMWRNGFMSVAAWFTITSCLLILGIFTVLTLNVNYAVNQIKEQCELQVFMKKDISEERLKGIEKEILSVQNVKSAELFTKEDMLDYAREDMFEGKEEQLTGFEDDNPFSDSYKIRLNDISAASETAEILEEIDDVDHVVNKQSVVDIIASVSRVIKKASAAVMLLLLVVSVVIMSNTIKLTVFNRRKEIGIMKYIGATDSFIKAPFIIEGMTIGLLSAAAAFGVVSWGYIMLERFVNSANIGIAAMLPYRGTAVLLGVLFVVMGGLIGIAGSMVSIKRYLKV